ncbi:hypothetical protein H1V43_22280 [Streptomyces sp. PSKA54]|uniref:Uncharacterized protein n=1 Tax=Streptomyces himalayensis subsp. aureolus TaxID=2758039 RepID=A0A7W2D3F6_9ACTN|nr:hypothetical protein [Streptomyces himalayensis]MBA4864035.1 hypothetical protein [Streptomyces himalayensis subsp. aureolus]
MPTAFPQEAAELRLLATRFDAHRGKLPDLSHPHRQPDLPLLARQLTELGELAAELGRDLRDQHARPASERSRLHLTHLATAAHAAGEATARLGRAVTQLAFLTDTQPQRESPDLLDARESAQAVIVDELAAIRVVLDDAANTLHSLAFHSSPPPLTTAAARSRSTLTASVPRAAVTVTSAGIPAARTGAIHGLRSR